MSIRIEGFNFAYGSTPVLRDVTIQTARSGELVGRCLIELGGSDA